MSTEDDISNAELSRQSIEILKALHRAGGSATTTEIRHLSPLDSNRQITYRINQTDELSDLVSVNQPERGPDDERIPPKVLTVTRRGEQIAAELAETDDEVEVEHLTAELKRIGEQADRFEDSSLGAWDESEQEHYDDLWIALRVFRKYLEEQVDPLVDKPLSEYREEVQQAERGGETE